jgi:hypothetical protein
VVGADLITIMPFIILYDWLHELTIGLQVSLLVEVKFTSHLLKGVSSS